MELNIETEVIVHMDGRVSKVFDDMDSANEYITYEEEVEKLIKGLENKWGNLPPHKITFRDIAQYLALNNISCQEIMQPQDEIEKFNYSFYQPTKEAQDE